MKMQRLIRTVFCLILLAVIAAAALLAVRHFRGGSSAPAISETPAPTAAVTAEPEPTPEPTPEITPEPTMSPEAVEALAAACLETPEKRSPAEALERIRTLGTYDSRYLDAVEKLGLDRELDPENPDEEICLLLLELSVNPELLDFLLDYPDGSAEKPAAAFRESELSGETEILMQYDPRWGYERFGSGPIAFTGCGPTCLSMAALHFTGNADATPDRVAAWTLENDYYVSGSGTKWLLFSEGAQSWGLGTRELPLWKGSIDAALEAGEWVVLCLKPGDFTLNGHFVVLAGLNGDGYRVLDPFSRARSSVSWSYEQLESQISNLWAVGKADDAS